jgi:alpha-amylase
MRKIYTTLLLFVASLTISAQDSNAGWPAEYPGVMLQGFYWDSYADTKWTNLKSQADELSQFFNLIWVPNSAYANSESNNMGYHPVYWFDHKSAFGSEAELRSMIDAFKDKKVGIIEDVVINHRASVNSDWLNFPEETYKEVKYRLTAADICNDDESKDNGFTPTGAADTGDKYPGARDLDHTGANVQKNVNAYLDFLLNGLGYVGFRYDYAKGFSAKYFGQYNKTAQPQFSVGEVWDNKTTIVNWINGTKVEGVVQSAAFDFTMKWNINKAFSNSNWELLNGEALANDADYARYAVTFVDNHDTYRDDNALKNNVCAANAYILTMPGTPCLFLPHWKDYKGSLKRLIAARKAVGINNQSTILNASVEGAGYVLKVQGTKGTAMLILGGSTGVSTTGFQLVTEGRKYKLYVSDGVDISSVTAITDTDAKTETTSVTIPSFCTVEDGETCAFFEAPTSFGTSINCWRWDNNYNYTKNEWPGSQCTKVGTSSGKDVYKWTFKESEKKSQSSPNKGIIFSGSGKQTGDMMFVNGGYYLEDGLWDSVSSAAGIQFVKGASSQNMDGHWYDLNGRRFSEEPTKKGVYIYQGKKILK